MPSLPELALLEAEHQDYTANKDNWEFLTDAYLGIGGFKDGTYLDKYPNEDESTTYTERQTIAHYPNYVKTVVKTYGGHLYKQNPVRDLGGDEVLETFEKKTDIKGHKHMNSLMKEVFYSSMTLGFTYVFVDSSDTLILTAAEEVEQDLRPYAYVLDPINVINWGLDSKGNFEWLIIKETYIKDGEVPFVEHTEVPRYRYWSKTEWAVWDIIDKTVIPVSSNTHTLGKIPIVTVYFEEISGSLIGNSGITEIAQLNKRLYNLLSELDDILRQQTFSTLTYPGDLKADTGLSTNRILTFDPEGKHAPEFIAPAASTTESYEIRIENTIKQIFALANLDHTGIATHTTEKSGVALILDFEKTEEALQSAAVKQAEAEKQIFELVLNWNGKLDVQIDEILSIVYPTTFGLKDNKLLIEAVQEAKDLGIPSTTFYKELIKELTLVLLPELPITTRNTINAEIEAAETLVNIDGSSLDNEGTLDDLEPQEPVEEESE